MSLLLLFNPPIDVVGESTGSLPASVRVREWRLAVVTTDEDPTSQITLKAPFASGLTEIWSGELLFATTHLAGAEEISAWLESLDGRVVSFKIPMREGVTGQEASWLAQLNSVPPLGSTEVQLSIGPATGTILAGTLIGLGDPDSGPYQLLEVLEDTEIIGVTTLPIAPRIRQRFSEGDLAAIGNVFGLFKLSTNDVDVQMAVVTGQAKVSVVEAL